MSVPLLTPYRYDRVSDGLSTPALLAQGLGVAYAAGISVPATVAILGLAQHLSWIGPLPGGLDVLSNVWIIGLAVSMYAVEFVATLVPGLASLWETVQTGVRPIAGALLAIATTVHLPGLYIAAVALLGGGLAITTHGAKLGVRYAVDASPEPFTNLAANVAELTTIVSVCLALWDHPYATLTAAVVLLALIALLVRHMLRTIQRGLARLMGMSRPTE